MAIFVIYTRLILATYFFLQVFVTVMIKHGMIFYGSYIALIQDRAVVKLSRGICIVGTILFNVGHFIDFESTKTSNILALTRGMPQKLIYSNKLVYFLAIVDLILVILLHVKIEIYKRQESLISSQLTGYTIVTYRKLVGMIFVCCLLILSRHLSLFDSHVETLMQYIIAQFMFLVAIPFYMIMKNENLFHYVNIKFQFCNNDIHSLNV